MFEKYNIEKPLNMEIEKNKKRSHNQLFSYCKNTNKNHNKNYNSDTGSNKNNVDNKNKYNKRPKKIDEKKNTDKSLSPLLILLNNLNNFDNDNDNILLNPIPPCQPPYVCPGKFCDHE